MRRRHARALGLALILVATAAKARTGAPGEIWSGTSAGFDLRWAENDITVRRSGRRVFSARDWAGAELAHFVAANATDEKGRPPDCTYRQAVRIVSLVGAMMSLEDSVTITCRREAHPAGLTRLITVDLSAAGPLADAGRDAIGRVDPRRPGRAMLLTGIFPAADVMSALAGTTPLRDVLRRKGIRPRTLPEFVGTVTDASGEGDACFVVPPDLLASFAFDRIEGDRVVVRLGLPGDGPCRSNLTTADLTFALPASLAPAVRRAGTGEAGFLADRGRRIAAGRVTTIDLRSGRGGGP